MLKIIHVVGARPNYMKTAPIMREMSRFPNYIQQYLVHTGQHYDANMSDVFFGDLQLAPPDQFLGVGSGTHAEQTARVMLAFEPIVQEMRPDLVLVVGDVNSTVACALVCSKLGIRIGHVEAGLRSYDRTMPEEINRILTDQMADILFTPSRDGDQNLLKEGIDPHKIKFVGNVMIDTLIQMQPMAAQRWETLCPTLGLDRFALVTLHRPANVDDPEKLNTLLDALGIVSKEIPVLFPVHPRTRTRIEALSKQAISPAIHLLDPQGYLDFLALESHASLVITDSGGVQEETTYLGVPCLTVRPNTERPVTLTEGTNRLVTSDLAALTEAAHNALTATQHKGHIPELWDGKAAERIVSHILDLN